MTPPDGQEQESPTPPDSSPPAEVPTGAGPTSEVPDAATVPAQEPAAAEAPQAPKAPEQKAEPEAPPSQTGTPPAEKPAAAAEKPAAAAARPAAERPARPAREAEPKEAPRVPPPGGSINEKLATAAAVTLAAAYMVPDVRGESVAVEVKPDEVPAVMTAARDQLGLRYLRCLSGVDWQEQGLEVAYHLVSLDTKEKLTVKTRVPTDAASIPSIASIFPAADWHERETRDMFGINFEGHPHLVPLLLPEDMTDHFPLRKDNPLQEIEELIWE
jgi:NADH-quinone oxidoreductase subunit C